MPKIQLRHDTSTNWTTYNPVLLEGECGVETDTNKIKIGDGVTAYNSLEYFGGDIDLSNYIQIDAPQVPLEYVEEQNNIAVESNDTIFWSKNDTIGDSYVISYYDSNDGSIYTRTKGSPASGVIDTNYVVTYNGSLSDKVIQFTDCNDSDYFYGATTLGCYIGNTDSNGIFTPYFCIASDSSYNYSFMELSGITRSQDDYGYGFTKWQASIRPTSNTFYRSQYNPLAWKIKIAVADNNGVPEFTINTYLKDGSGGSTVTYIPTYNTDIADLNTVVFPMLNYQASSSQYNYTIANWGIFDNQGNQLWKVNGTTKKLKLNIGDGLAIQNGNLVNTNPTSVTVDQTYNATSANAQSGTAVAGAIGDKVDISSLSQVHCVVETSPISLLPSWYRVYDDGWCEEGGLLLGVTPNTWNSINFINTFSNTYLNVQLTAYSEYSLYPDQFACYQNLTTTGMNIGTRYLSSNENATISWSVAGFVSQGV